MVKKTIGVFFDGNSSVPQQIELSFDKTKKEFHFVSSNMETYCWKIEVVSFEKKAGTLHLQQGNDPIQTISVKEVAFIEELTEFRKNNGSLGWYHRLLDLGIRSHAVFAVLIMVFIGLSYLYVIPWIAEKSVVLIPEEYDNKLGEAFIEQNMFFSSVDSAKTNTLNLFAKELKLRNTKKLHFKVVDSDIVNAFALPDGTIVIYSGIIDSMKNYDELVGLLGHEVAHVNHRHGMKMLCRNLSGYLFVSAILGDANGIMAIIGDNVNSLQSLSFSREFEKQADLEGFATLNKNQINPMGMSNLFKRLQDKRFISIPEFLSSHPVTEERIDYINQMVEDKSYPYKENPKLKSLFLEIKQ
jgi:Zn-dependent protease with chaperone function